MLADYLERIGMDTPPAADVEGLARVLTAHRFAIPFENLDIMLGRGIELSLEAIAARLVHARRGGYCFQQNGLFAAMLDAMGFAVRPLLARVWLGSGQGLPDEVPPRTHMLLAVTIDGRDWIADAGFGGSQTVPLLLIGGTEAATPDGARHRLRAASMPGDPEGTWLLERLGPAAATDGRTKVSDAWQPQYGFAEHAAVQADILQANHWTSTRADTRFTSLHIASRPTPTGFAALTDCALSVYDGGDVSRRTIERPDEYRAVLGDIFGIELALADVQRLPLFRCGHLTDKRE